MVGPLRSPRRPAVLRGRLVLAALCAALLTGACVVTPSSSGSDKTESPLRRAVDEGRVELDLTAPRTPAELGLRPGQESAIIDRGAGDDLVDVEVRLPGGVVYQRKAFAIGAELRRPLLPDSLHSVGLNVRAESRDDMFDALSRDIQQLGLNPYAIGSLGSEVEAGSRDGSPINGVIKGRRFGHVTPSVEARANPKTDSWVLVYSFSWRVDPVTSPPPATPPTQAAMAP